MRGDSATPDQIRAVLQGLDYPASKDAIVDHASRHADPSALRLLRALPVAIYDNRKQVMEAVPFDRADTAGQTMKDKATQRRRHTKPGLAEHEKQTPPTPIEEELGWNRKR